MEKDKVGRGRAARLPPFAVRAAGALRARTTSMATLRTHGKAARMFVLAAAGRAAGGQGQVPGAGAPGRRQQRGRLCGQATAQTACWRMGAASPAWLPCVLERHARKRSSRAHTGARARQLWARPVNDLARPARTRPPGRRGQAARRHAARGPQGREAAGALGQRACHTTPREARYAAGVRQSQGPGSRVPRACASRGRRRTRDGSGPAFAVQGRRRAHAAVPPASVRR